MADLTRPDFGEAWASEGEKLSPDSVKIKLGWVQEMMPYQFQNFLQSRQDEAILYLLQKGVPEYSPTQEYTANKSVVVYQGNLYMATSTATGVLPTATASWKRISPTIGANGAVAISSGGTGATSVAEARTNLGLGTASTANLPSTNGVVVRSADNTLISRLLTGTSGNISITNPDGVSGNININVGTNVAQLDKDSSWTSKGGITLPKGSSGERGVEVAGKIRYNTELQKFEGYDGTSWNALGAASEVEITTLSGDGVTTSFTLNTPAFSESSTDVYIGGVYQNKGTYSVSGTTLTFSEAPTPGTDNIQVVSRRVVDLGIARASQVSIEDTSNYYTSPTVEGALREVGEDFAKLTSYTGNIAADAEWSDVPAHSDPAFDVQAQALVERLEFLNEPDFTKNYVQGTLGERLKERVSVKAFPWLARGDFETDDTEAIRAADAWCAERGLELFFPDGVYRCTDGIDRKADWRGVKAPQLAPFPLIGDDKKFLRPGYKHLMPGSSLIFAGVGVATASTQRDDQYASFTYCVRSSVTGQRIKDLAIILDCDVYDAEGNLTQLGADHVASFDVGHYIDDAAQTTHDDVIVFGYFDVAGTVVRSVLGNDDPDYTIFRGGGTMGRHGLALIGSQYDDGRDSGLSGTQTYGFDMFTLDHHSRGSSTAAEIYADADTWRCLYIDGWTDASQANLNGHYFYGGVLRTYAIHPVEFDCASQINMYGVVHETSNWVGVPNAATKQWLASDQTFGVHLFGVRFSTDVGLLGPDFGHNMRGQLTLSGCSALGMEGIVVAERAPDGSGMHWVKVGGASGGTGDPAIQISSGPIVNSTSGWSLRADIDQGESLEIRRSGAAVAQISADGVASFIRQKMWPVGSALTVSENTIAVTRGNHVIDASGSPTVTVINGGVDGEILRLRKTGSGTVTIAEGGNIVTPGGSVALTAITDSLLLSKQGSTWVVNSFPDNA